MLYGFITTKHKEPNNVSSASILDENLRFFMHSALGFVSKSNDMFNNRNKNKEETWCSLSLEDLYTMWTKSFRYCNAGKRSRGSSRRRGSNSESSIRSRKASTKVALAWAETREWNLAYARRKNLRKSWAEGIFVSEINRKVQFQKLPSIVYLKSWQWETTNCHCSAINKKDNFKDN